MIKETIYYSAFCDICKEPCYRFGDMENTENPSRDWLIYGLDKEGWEYKKLTYGEEIICPSCKRKLKKLKKEKNEKS